MRNIRNGSQSSNPAYKANLRNIRRPECKKAYLDDQGRLRIPLDADDKYRYWAGGQSVFDTLLELGASDKEIEAHIGPT